MGNARSQPVAEEEIDPWWSPPKPQTTVNKEEVIQIRNNNDEFKQELARKRDKRRELIAEKRKEMQDLREEASKQKQENENLHRLLEQRTEAAENVALVKENEQLKQTIVELRTELIKSEVLTDKNNQLRSDIAKLQEELQMVNAEVVGFEKERFEYQTHVAALKDVAKVSKQMLVIREQQLTEVSDTKILLAKIC